MADEITVTQRLQVNDGNYFKVDRHITGLKNDLTVATGTPGDRGIQEIGYAAHELLVVSADLDTQGWAYFRNLDTTNYVEIGVQDSDNSFTAFVKLIAGNSALFPLATGTIYAQASSVGAAAVSLEWEIIAV